MHVARTDRLTRYASSAGRGKQAMDSTGIPPAYTVTVVGDAWCAYRRYTQSRHALCNAHLPRLLTFIKAVCAEQRQWTDPSPNSSSRSKPQASGSAVRAGGS